MLLALVLAAASPTIAPLPPTGRWLVDYAQNMCVLSRDYGAAGSGRRLTLGLRPWPMGTETEIVLATTDDAPEVSSGRAELTLLPAGVPVRGSFNRYHMPESSVRLATLTLAQDALAGVRTASAISLRLGGGKTYALAIPAIEAGMKALDVCQTDLLRTWGIDPAERAQVVTLPKGRPADLFGSVEYPASAVRAGEQGRTIAVALLDEAGVVRSCVVAATSGSTALDQATCAVLLKRGRFSPGRDKDGSPVPAHIVVPVRWILPD